jgi:hypothetical protein
MVPSVASNTGQLESDLAEPAQKKPSPAQDDFLAGVFVAVFDGVFAAGAAGAGEVMVTVLMVSSFGKLFSR